MNCQTFDHARAGIICGDCIIAVYDTHGGKPCLSEDCPRLPCPNYVGKKDKKE